MSVKGVIFHTQEHDNVHKDSKHVDAQNKTMFFTRQLEEVKSRTYDEKNQPRKYAQLIPINTSTNPGARTITWRSFKKIGQAVWISAYGADVPRATSVGTEQSVKPDRFIQGAEWSYDEVLAAQMAGENLEMRHMDPVIQSLETFQNRIAWFGDSDKGINGFINYPGITEYNTPNGVGGNPEWSTKTTDEIIADVAGMMDTFDNVTNEAGSQINWTLITPKSQYNILRDTPYGDSKDYTLLQWILKNYTQITTIESVKELEGAGAGGSDRMMFYPRDPDVLELEIPEMRKVHEMHVHSTKTEIDVSQKTAGVIVYYPLEIIYADDI